MTSPDADFSLASEVSFRRARLEDVPAIVRLLADDRLGAAREVVTEPLPAAYWEAFQEIDADPREELIVADLRGSVAGCVQLTILPGLSQVGAWRAQLEGVRVDSALRGRGIGQRMVCHAVQRARERGCRLVQLTSNRVRVDAVRFYERLGFVPSHAGMKLPL